MIQALIVLAALASPAQESPAGKKLVFAFKDASVDAVLLYVSQVTGWIFVQEAPSRGTITAYSQAEVPLSRCLEFLEVSLKPLGLGVRPSGGILRVVELAKTPSLLPGVHVGGDPVGIPLSDEARTQIVILKFAAAVDVAKELGDVFRKALGDGGQIAVAARSNALLLSGRSEGIHRVAEILRVIDQSASAQLQVRVFPLQHASAVEVAKTLNDVYKKETAKPDPAVPGFMRMLRPAPETPAAASPAHETVRITAEPRTNAVIVGATEDNLTLIGALIGQLDQDSAELRTYVVPLHTDAAGVASLLNALLNGQAKSAAASGVRSDGTLSPGQTAPSAAAAPATPTRRR